ncbi:MAG TPA: hypothetical protein VMJ14_02330 [Burkholderiales bacterium]|nr:hypothetical protein [Burkholderiales bacterium]
MDIKVGQVLEFVDDVSVEGRTVKRGARARVGYILTEVVEPKLTLVLLGSGKPETIVVEHHVAGIHCRIVSESP